LIGKRAIVWNGWISYLAGRIHECLLGGVAPIKAENPANSIGFPSRKR